MYFNRGLVTGSSRVGVSKSVCKKKKENIFFNMGKKKLFFCDVAKYLYVCEGSLRSLFPP